MSRKDTEGNSPCFSPEMYQALRFRAPDFEQYAESLLQMVTVQFQIAVGRPGPWGLETFVSLPSAIPNQSGLYILVLETPPTADPRFGSSGLDIYCGQAHGKKKRNSEWKGLPLRVKTYEQQSGMDSAKLEKLRQNQGDRGKTLHIYLLCSLPSVKVHARVVALVTERPRDVIAMAELQYDLSIMESTLVVLMGSMMSEEGQVAFQSPINWMPHSAEWARKARCSIAGLPCPIGYGANRALPCSQFVNQVVLATYHDKLCRILKTVFDGCGTVIKSVNDNWTYDADFVWCSTDRYPTIWHLIQAWLVLDCPREARHVTTRDVQLFWRNHANSRILPQWESISTIEPAPELSPCFSACIALSIQGAFAVDLRDHIRDYLIAKSLLFSDPETSRQYGDHRIHASVCSQMSYWIEIHRSYQSCRSNIPLRLSTAERLLSFFQEKRDIWLGKWKQELDPKSPSKTSGKLTNDCLSHTSIPHQVKPVTLVAQKTRDLIRQVVEEGMGILADVPCSNCIRRKKPCWIHINDKLGKCLDCVRGVVGEMKLRECSLSRGVGDEEFASRNCRPFMTASKQGRAPPKSERTTV